MATTIPITIPIMATVLLKNKGKWRFIKIRYHRAIDNVIGLQFLQMLTCLNAFIDQTLNTD